MSGKKLTLGTKAPISAQYEILGPRGGRTGTERTSVTLPAELPGR